MAKSNGPKQKTASSLPRPNRGRSFIRRHPVITLLVCLLVAAAAFVPWHDYQTKQAIEKDKQRFAQADADLQKVVTDIVADTGEPYKSEKDNSCFLRSVKFEAQPISCGVNARLYYGVTSPNLATTLFQQVSTRLQKEWRLTEKEQSSNLEGYPSFHVISTQSNPPASDAQKIYEVYSSSNIDMVCRATYTYYDGLNPPYENYPTSTSANILYASIGCNADAKIEHFPVRE